MLKLEKLLWLDDECLRADALPECFGDRYLCANNPLFAKARGLFFASGFRYSCEADRLWRNYGSFPLLMLQEMLDSGIVPYKDTTATIRFILEHTPDLGIAAHLLLNTLQRNYLLHESAHCIAYRLLASELGTKGVISTKHEYVIVSLLCESYANTIERLAGALATSDVHRLFFTLNSYTDGRDRVGSLLRDAVRIFSLADTFRIGILAFMHLNTHPESPDEAAINTIIDTAFHGRPLTDPKRVLLKVLVNNGFGLSKRFRTQTTPLFLTYMGCDKEFQFICQQPFTQDTILSMGILDSANRLISVTCEGINNELVPCPAPITAEYAFQFSAEDYAWTAETVE